MQASLPGKVVALVRPFLRVSATGWSSLSFFGTLIHGVGWQRSGGDAGVLIGRSGRELKSRALQEEGSSAPKQGTPLRLGHPHASDPSRL